MANFDVICKYCYCMLVVVALCYVPECETARYRGKMRHKNRKSNLKGMRRIKATHKSFSRKVQKAATLEDFVALFENSNDVNATVMRVLDESFKDSLESSQLTKGPASQMNPQNLQNGSQDPLLQIREQLKNQECKKPQSVLLDTHEVLGLDRGFLQYAYPNCIQVNRCGSHSGCCGLETLACVPKAGHIQNVTRQVLFGNVYLNHEPGGKDTAVMGYTVTVEEHTLCECREIPNCNDLVCDSPMIRDPVNCKCKCPKRCPLPYRHNVDTCDCECGDERTQAGRACRKIFRGKQSMNRNECSCVKSRQCREPVCRSKYIFDNTTCDCVRIPSKERIAHNENDTYPVIELDIEVRDGRGGPPSLEVHTAGGVGLQTRVRSSLAHLAKSSQKVVPDRSKTDTLQQPVLSGMSAETNEYRHSSHTRFNGTQHGKHNASGSAKAKITGFQQAPDELNVTDIKDKYAVDLKPNGTDQGTISRPKTSVDVFTNGLPDRHSTPQQEYEAPVNEINVFDPTGTIIESEGVNEDTTPSYSSELEYFSYSSSNDDESKSEDNIEHPLMNPDFRIFESDGGSGDLEGP